MLDEATPRDSGRGPPPVTIIRSMPEERAQGSNTDGDVLLELRNVTRRFGRPPRVVTALQSLDLAFAGGRIVGLVGDNGAGKTTLLELATGLVAPTSGNVHVLGERLHRPTARVGRAIGFAGADDRALEPRLTAREALRLAGALRDLDARILRARIDALSGELSMDEWLDRRTQDLSTGQRARVNIARALLADPRVVLLDEATRSLDAEGRASVAAAMRARADRGGLVLWSSHELEFVESVADDLVVLDRGRVLAAGPLTTLLGAADEGWEVTFATDAQRNDAAGNSDELTAGVDPRTLRAAFANGGELVALARDRSSGIVQITRLGRCSLVDLLRTSRGAEPRELPPQQLSRTDTTQVEERRRSRAAGAPSALGALGEACRALAALTRRDVLVHLSYRFKLVTQAAVVATWAALFHFMGRMLSSAPDEVGRSIGHDPAGYLLLGLAVLQVSQTALIHMGQALREEQLRGTLKPLLQSGCSPALLVLGSLVWPMSVTLGLMATMLTIAAVELGASFQTSGIGAAFVVTALGITSLASLGLVSAALVLVFKRGDPVAVAVNLASLLLAGAYFPRELLPQGVQALAVLLPHTHFVDGLRAALLTGPSRAELLGPLRGLGLCALFLVPLAACVWASAERFARRRGDMGRS